MAKHLTSDEQRAGLADAAKLRDRYWGPYKVLKWVNSADVELEIPKSNTGAHNVFHISRIKKAADTAAAAKKLPLPRWMRNGLPSKLTEEDRDYEIMLFEYALITIRETASFSKGCSRVCLLGLHAATSP